MGIIVAPFKIFLVLTEGSKDSVSLHEAYQTHQQKDDAMAQPVTTVFHTTGKPAQGATLGDKSDTSKDTGEELVDFLQAFEKVIENEVHVEATVALAVGSSEEPVVDPDQIEGPIAKDVSDSGVLPVPARVSDVSISDEADMAVDSIGAPAEHPKESASGLPSDRDRENAVSTKPAAPVEPTLTGLEAGAGLEPESRPSDVSIERPEPAPQVPGTSKSIPEPESLPAMELKQGPSESTGEKPPNEVAHAHRGDQIGLKRYAQVSAQGQSANAKQVSGPIGTSVIALAATGRAGAETSIKDVEPAKGSKRLTSSSRSEYPTLQTIKEAPKVIGQSRAEPTSLNAPIAGLGTTNLLSAGPDAELIPLVQSSQTGISAITSASAPQQVTAYGAPPDAAKAVAHQMAVSVNQANGGVTELQLSPAELGKVRLVLTAQDAGLVVSVLAERPETQEMLRRHIDVLGQEFGQLGYQDISFEFEQGTAKHQDDNQTEQAGKQPMHTDEIQLQPDVHLIASAGLDLRL